MKHTLRRGLFSLAIIALAAAAASAGVLAWRALHPPPQWTAAPGAQPVVAPQPPALRVGERRPDFTLPDTTQTPRSVSEFDGKLLIVNFWATWCPPCLEEIPAFVRLQHAYAERGVQFLGVALDAGDEVRAFMREHAVNYPSVYGGHEAIALSKAYGNRIGALPFTVVVGRDGTVLSMHQGVFHEADLRAVIDANL
jgi:peroxiredoxin